MSHRPFRFVHASDFHLEMPLAGLAEVPDHLREPLLEAAYTAAARVLRHGRGRGGRVPGPLRRCPAPSADRPPRAAVPLPTVCPAGPTANPRLLGHRRRRSARGLAAGHPLARERPPLRPRPRLGADPPAPTGRRWRGCCLHGRDGNRLVRREISIPTRPASTPSPSSTGRSRPPPWSLRGIDYWALGGRHDRSTLFSARRWPITPGVLKAGDPARPASTAARWSRWTKPASRAHT